MRGQEKEGPKGQAEVIIEMIQRNAALLHFIEENCPLDKERIALLQEILLQMEENGRVEDENKIYMYGTLIRGQDLMARQMFLWLLGMTGKNKQGEGK